MLRDKNLVPLSHQHQHALALCVRIDRASDERLAAFLPEIRQIWETEISWHFSAEEQILFPAARSFPELDSLVQELLREHEQIRSFVIEPDTDALNIAAMRQFATVLASHIRKEERQLFEACQRLMRLDQLTEIGKELNRVLAAAQAQSCSIPPPAR